MSAPAVTHVTFNALVSVATGIKPRFLAAEFDDAAWHRGCDWQKTDVLALLSAADVVERYARPTCPECAVHLDAALEMAEGAKP